LSQQSYFVSLLLKSLRHGAMLADQFAQCVVVQSVSQCRTPNPKSTYGRKHKSRFWFRSPVHWLLRSVRGL
jgi:hypothetical protein